MRWLTLLARHWRIAAPLLGLLSLIWLGEYLLSKRDARIANETAARLDTEARDKRDSIQDRIDAVPHIPRDDRFDRLCGGLALKGDPCAAREAD